jgi:hypothetical protein
MKSICPLPPFATHSPPLGHRGDDDGGVGPEPAGAALDVHELLHTNVRAKAGLQFGGVECGGASCQVAKAQKSKGMCLGWVGGLAQRTVRVCELLRVGGGAETNQGM